MKIKNNPSADYVQPIAGLHSAVIERIIDLGTSDQVFEGKPVTKRELMFVFSLPNQTHTWEEEKGPERIHISRWFTRSLHKKGNLRPFIESITGKGLNDDDFDASSLIGMNCALNIIEGNNGNMRIASVSPVMEGSATHEAVNPVLFDLDDFKIEEFNKLSEKLQERIKLTPEYKLIEGNPLITS